MKYTGRSSLADNLKRLRKQFGLTQLAVAEALGIERSRYAHYENNTAPSTENLRKLAAIFNVTIDELLDSSPQINVFYETNASSLFETFMFTELKNDEKSLILKYRLLSGEAKEEVLKALEEKIEKSEE